jgi:hypothetical protein
MTRAAINWILDSNNKRRRWIAAGVVLIGLGAMNQQPHGTMGVRPAGYTPVQARGFSGGVVNNSAGWVNNGAGPAMAGSPSQYQSADNEPGMAGGDSAPQTGGFVPSTPAAASDNSTQVPTSGDSVPESVNTNFSDYMRDQQRVVSENDGQTYVVNSNADPNQMTDTRDSTSGFTQAAPGSEAAGYAEVVPSGATTVDTSTSTPVDTSGTSSTTSGE